MLDAIVLLRKPKPLLGHIPASFHFRRNFNLTAQTASVAS